MAEHTKGQQPNRDRQTESNRPGHLQENVEHQKGSADRGSASSLDEKSSTMGRRDKGTGMSTKDGLTGSDLDGQVTE